MDAQLTVDVQAGNIVVIRIGEALHFRTVDAFKSVCRHWIGAGARKLVLDFSRTKVLDSSGVGAVMGIYRHLKGLKGEVIIAAPSKAVESTFRLVGLHKVLPLRESVLSALEVLGAVPVSRAARAGGVSGPSLPR